MEEAKSDDPKDDAATSAALFDLSSYTGGAPLLPMEGTTAEASGATDVGTTHGMFDQELAKHDGEKKMGRPSHPAWQYFVRGEKRNRFHHNAYCKFCAEHGVEPVAVRGVSGNMIRHLQKCIYCPADVVVQLKLLCAQKDAASFNKKHQAQSRSVDMLLLETPPAPKKKARKSEGQNEDGAAPMTTTGTEEIAAKNTSADHDSTGVEDFMPLQMPLLSSDMNGGITSTISAKPLGYDEGSVLRKKPETSTKSRVGEAIKKPGRTRVIHARLTPTEYHVPRSMNKDIDQVTLNKLVTTATLSVGLPWDWVSMDQSIFGGLHSKIEGPTTEILQQIGTSSHDKQLMKMKDEQIGVTLAVNSWRGKYPRSDFVLLSLVNALGEATPWELIDIGLEESSPNDLAEKIKSNLASLQDKGIHVINIVADTTFAYTSARLAVSSNDWTNSALPVLPCFSNLLQILLGVILTRSDKSMDTIGEAIDLVRMFSNPRVLKVLRRECGDPDAVLCTPTYSDWYSFIESIDSIRQYEDMIKIITSKIVQASSDAGQSATANSDRPRTANARKDSAGNTVDELAGCGLSAATIQTVQSTEFWEHVVALSELTSPLKETYKMMSSTCTTSFSLSDVFYQLGRMQQQFAIILSDWEDTVGGGRSVEQVRFLLQTIGNMWKMYDQPLMVLSYTFNYNLQHPFFARHQPALQWLSVGKYAKQYFRGWFCAASATRNPSRILALSDEAVAQFMEDILAFKERKYPFDTESMCDFENPKLFYMLISDSHPLMHMFGSRLFSFATCTPSLENVLPGKSFIPSLSSVTYPQEALQPLLRVSLFAHTAMRLSKEVLGFVQGNRPKTNGVAATGDAQSQSDAISDETQSAFPSILNSSGKPSTTQADANAAKFDKIWTRKHWTLVAKEWKAHWKKETDDTDLLQCPRILEAFAPDLSLDQIFKDKLPSRLPHDREDAVVDV